MHTNVEFRGWGFVPEGISKWQVKCLYKLSNKLFFVKLKIKYFNISGALVDITLPIYSCSCSYDILYVGLISFWL